MDSVYLLGTIQNHNTADPLFLLGALYGVPQPAEAVSKSISDTGAGSDALSNLLARFSVADSIVGSDGWGLLAKTTMADEGSGSDTMANLRAQLSVIESAVGSDALTLAIRMAIADTGVSSDALGFIAKASIADVGFGLDDLAGLLAHLLIPENGNGSDALTNLLTWLLILESGSGSDTVQKALQKIYKILSDAGSGADLLNILAQIELADFAAGNDIIFGPIQPEFLINLKSHITPGLTLVSGISDKEEKESELTPIIIVRSNK